MQITFGKHDGKSAELIVLRKPDYVYWLLQQHDATGRLLGLNKEAWRLLKIFDQKPFQCKCMGSNCSALATDITLYGNSFAPHWWCDNCNIEQLGASGWKLQRIRKYSAALKYANNHCRGHKDAFSALITTMARAKGLPNRVGESQAAAFFIT